MKTKTAEIDLSLAAGFFDGLKPEQRLTVTQWADKYRYLASEASSEPGQWRTARVPYLAEIMDKLSPSDPCKEIVFMKGSQIGGTEAAINFIGYCIDKAPSSIMFLQPTDTVSKRNSKMRIDPMIEATPRLRKRIAEKRSRDSGNTTFQKDFPGGVLLMAGANSPVGLRSVPIRYLVMDEIDQYPSDLGGEGSPIDLAKARTRNYSKKKIILISSPTVRGSSVIEDAYSETDKRKYYVPCPHCEHMQVLKWAQVKWEKGKYHTTRYECESCHEGIEERFKPKMLAGGEWRVTNPENLNINRVGYHLSALYSPLGWYSWAEAAEEWEAAQSDQNKLKVFINTVLGETWQEKGEAPDHERLYERREKYERNRPCNSVGMITVGVDVQKDRLECEIVGWCREKRSYSIDYRVIPGDTASEQPWRELDGIVNEQWEREDGVMLPMRMMAVDTGYNTQHAYEFCRRHDPSRVVPIKGKDRNDMGLFTPTTVDVSFQGKRTGRVSLWHIGVGYYKSELYGFLRQNPDVETGEIPPGYCYFPEYDLDYFKQLTAEVQKKTQNRRGYTVYAWEKIRDRNEALDCRVYARAGAAIIGIDRFQDHHWEALESGSHAIERKKNQKKTRKNRGITGNRGGSFWD